MVMVTISVKAAFIICNGASRKDFDLNRLKPYPTFGCNALYREWEPTWLVSIDEGITKEIRDSDFDDDRHIVPPYEEQFEPAEYNPKQPRSNAGMNAVQEAIRRGYDKLYILGMDFILEDDRFTMSNLYDGTDNYTMDTRATANDQMARTGYLSWFCNQHPDVSFRFVIPEGVKSVRKVNAPNVAGTFYSTLEKRLDEDVL